MPLSKPTNLTQDGALAQPDTYFLSPELSQRSDLLIHLTENSNLIPLVRGGEGIGKSTFIQHLVSVAPENWVSVLVGADVMLQPDALLAHLARRFGRDDRSDRLMDELSIHFDDLRHNGHLPVIIVDDAHLLPETSIITLLRLHERGPDVALAQILLFAEPEIDALLQTQQLRAMNLPALQLLDMPEFTLEQTERYLQHLLPVDAFRAVTDSQIQKIYAETGGLPGLIKQQARRFIGVANEQVMEPTSRRRIPGKAIIAGGAAAIVVLLVLVYQNEINAVFSGEDENSVAVSAHEEQKEWTDDSSSLVIPDYALENMPGVDAPQMDVVDQDAPADDEGDGVDIEVAVEEPEEKISEVVVEAQTKIELPKADQVVLQPLPDLPQQTQKTDQSAQRQRENIPSVAEKKRVISPKVRKTDPAINEKATLAASDKKVRSKKVESQVAKVVKSEADSPKVKAQQIKPERSKKETLLQKAKSSQHTPKVQKKTPPVKMTQQKVSAKVDVGKSAPQPKATAALMADDANSSGGDSRTAPAPVEDRSIRLGSVGVSPKKTKDVPVVVIQSDKPSEQVVKKEVAVGIAKPPSVTKPKASPGGILREDWLLQQNPSSYTIQIAGMQDESGIAEFIKRSSLHGTTAYYRTTRSGKRWFPVLYGVYPNRENAVKAQALLPEKIRKSGAWVRTLGSVQKDIGAR